MPTTSTPAFDEAKAEVQFLRWIFGWNLPVSWGMVMVIVGGVGYLIGFPYAAGFLGVLAGPVVWYLDTRYVDRHYESLREAYVADIGTIGPNVLRAAGAAEDAATFTLVTEPDSTPLLLEAPKQYDATVLGVDETAVWLYGETILDLVFMEATVGTDPEEVRRVDLAALESVTYRDGALELQTTDGETVTALTSTEPEAAMAAIRERMDESEA